jgi:ABC-2 type transport system ATP-binding protein
MIKTEGLTKVFDEFTAVDDVTLQVEAGEVLALLGPNGAGKTTTVRMLTSILEPTEGTATINGFDVVEDAEQVRADVGILTEAHGLYLRQRGREYLDFFGELYGIDEKTRSQRAETLTERFGLLYAIDRRIGEYSKGMRQKLALVRALMHDPPVLLLDEPTSAMDPHSARQVRNAIRDLRGDGRAIILTTHNLPEAEELADRIAIIRRGKIIATGTALDLKARLLGPPLFKVQLGEPLNGALDALEPLVEVTASGHDWVTYRADDPRQTNPVLVNQLATAGHDVITLSEIPQSLEEVYLRVVNEPEEGEV